MNRKLAGIILLIVGLLAGIAGLVADLIGLGSSGGFGTGQLIITVVGFMMAVAGVLMVLNKRPVKK